MSQVTIEQAISHLKNLKDNGKIRTSNSNPFINAYFWKGEFIFSEGYPSKESAEFNADKSYKTLRDFKKNNPYYKELYVGPWHLFGTEVSKVEYLGTICIW